MSTKDDFDLPDKPEFELPPAAPEVIVVAEDLRPGPAEVKPFKKTWAEQYAKPTLPPGIHLLDLLIAVLASVCAWSVVSSWWWIFAS